MNLSKIRPEPDKEPKCTCEGVNSQPNSSEYNQTLMSQRESSQKCEREVTSSIKDSQMIEPSGLSTVPPVAIFNEVKKEQVFSQAQRKRNPANFVSWAKQQASPAPATAVTTSRRTAGVIDLQIGQAESKKL